MQHRSYAEILSVCSFKKGQSMAELSTGRRSRGGGGAARRAERTSIKIETAKYIERNIPNFDLLSEEAL